MNPVFQAPSEFQAGQGAIIVALTGPDATITKAITYADAFNNIPRVAFGIKSYSGKQIFNLGQ